MYMNVTVPTWFICTECGEAEKVDDFNGTFIPDGWYLQRNDKSWDVYCPCINVPASLPPEKDGTGYTRSGGTTTWNPSQYTTTTNLTFDYFPPLKFNKKGPLQEKADAILAEIEEEKAEQERRWKAWEETKHSKHMDPTCERCVEEIERIKRELKNYGKGNKDEN
jgi:hypothetical protein